MNFFIYLKLYFIVFMDKKNLSTFKKRTYYEAFGINHEYPKIFKFKFKFDDDISVIKKYIMYRN